MVQRLGQNLRPHLPTTSVSPSSFKNCLRTWLTVLADQQLSATIWAKLPRNGGWLAELQQYAEQVNPKPTVYLLSRRSLPPADWYIPVPLPSDQPLRRSYGFIAIAPTVAMMALAQRQPPAPTPLPLTPEAGEEAGRSVIELTVSVQPAALRDTLDGLQDLVRASVEENPDRDDLVALLDTWDSQFTLPSLVDPILIDHLMAAYSQQQENSRQHIQGLRKQAMTANSLSSQNEALMTTLQIKDDFLSSAGQQLRAPLTTIKTALPLLSSPTLKASLRQRYLDMISRECDRQSALITGVLDLLQIEMSLASVTPGPLQVFDVVPGVVSTYQPIAQEKGVQLAYTIPDNLPEISCPDSWLRQIVIHLLHNSIKYTASGGQVWVTAAAEGSDWVMLEVRDTGQGISPQDISQVFNHFYRGRQTQDSDGAGLGLTIVQQLLLYCGGTIQVDSHVGSGSQFRVRLPTVIPET